MNTFDSNMITIIKLLIQTEDYMTAEKIAFITGISVRKVRDTIQGYREMMTHYGIQIESKPRIGYHIGIINVKQYQNFLSLVDEVSNEMVLPQTQEERIIYIIRKLLSTRSYLKIEDLSEALAISRSTMNRLMKDIRAKLLEYRLDLSHKPFYGVRIVGREIDYRLCMAQYFFYTNKSNSAAWLMNKDMQKKIENGLYEILYETNFHISDIGFSNLVVHLLVAIKRIECEHYNNEIAQSMNMEKEYPKEYEIAMKITERFEEIFNVSFPWNEIQYITMHLLGKQTFSSANMINEGTLAFVDKLLYTIKSQFSFDFLSDFELRTVLATHIQPMLHRIKFGMKLTNPLLQKIKVEIPLAFKMALLTREIMREINGNDISEDEIGYLALHFALAIEKNHKDIEKKKILIVCSTGKGTAQMIKYKIIKKYGVHINEIDLTSTFELEKIDLSMYDCILSSIPLPFEVGIPSMQISSILQKEELDSIGELLLDINSDYNFIQSAMKSEVFFFEQSFETKQEVLDKMTDEIIQFYSLNSDFKQAVFKRESLSSTEIGNMIAMPHPYTFEAEEIIFSFMSLKKPIRWDTQTIKYIFMIALPDHQLGDEFNDVLSSFVLDVDKINRLSRVREVKEFIKLFNE